MARCYIIDTNIFLHYGLPDQICWPAEDVGSATVIVVCPPVLQELDSHKKALPDARLRKRAAGALAWVRSALAACEPQEGPQPLSVVVIAEEPLIQWGEHGLDPMVPDDRILGHAIRLRAEGYEPVIATEETLLQVKANSKGIEAYCPPPEDRLPDTLTEEEKRQQQELNELREWRNALPELRLAFGPDAADHTECVPLGQDFAEGTPVDDLVARKRGALEKGPRVELTGRVRASVVRDFLVSEEAMRRYGDEVEEYLSGPYRRFAEHLLAYRHRMRRVVELTLVLSNRGHQSADDIDVVLRCADATFIHPEDAPEAPEQPNPPKRPRSRYEAMLESATTPAILPAPFLRSPQIPYVAPRRRGPNVREGNRTAWYWLLRLKQHQSETLAPVLAELDDDHAGSGFQLHYEIVTPSRPGTATGTLHVRVKPPDD